MYTTVTFPAVTPVTTPPALIVAEPVPFMIDHVPPPVAFVKAGVVVPVHTVAAPPPIAAGNGFTVIDCPLFVPLGFVTKTVPDVVPAATTAVIVVAFTRTTAVQAVPFIETVFAPAAKLNPVIVIVLPTQTGFGVILVTPMY